MVCVARLSAGLTSSIWAYGVRLVLFGMQNRTLRPYSAATIRTSMWVPQLRVVAPLRWGCGCRCRLMKSVRFAAGGLFPSRLAFSLELCSLFRQF
jgi:hypothetical protein